MKLENPYSAEETIKRLQDLLTTTSTKRSHHKDALALLEKAVSKAGIDKAYAAEMDEALTKGSTIEMRDLFSPFGDYWAPSKGTYPFYPHSDAVNAIDSAMHIIKYDVHPGALKEHVELA